MECFKKLDHFLTLLHTKSDNHFNFGQIIVNIYLIIEGLPDPARRLLLEQPIDKDPTTNRVNYFRNMVDFIGVCDTDKKLRPYVRHLIALFDYVKNDSATNLCVCKMSTDKPLLNLKFKAANVYSAMCSPRKFINQIKNSSAPKPRSFEKYSKPEFIQTVTGFITYSTINEEGIIETKKMIDDCTKLESLLRPNDEYSSDNIPALGEREFEEQYFKRMYKYACEISIQSEVYAMCNNKSPGAVAYSIFLNFKM